MRFILTITTLFFFYPVVIQAQSEEGNKRNLPVREYELTIRKEMVNKTGKSVEGMTINGSIPGPILEFTEGEYAIIHVTNQMDVETSVHWHGILLPNFFDGVPYLTTPPIKPGETFTYEFEIKQAGTYWYHSHTMLQEQSGVFGSLVFHPKNQKLEYDRELVLMLSDWTNENPHHVLKTLKRGTEWYNIAKGTATPLNQVISRGALGAQLNFWRQRMEGADIADIYYPAFLINGEQLLDYPHFKPGEKVRLRIIDGSASTSFWLTFGGNQDPLLVSADGLDVEPVRKNKTFIAVAETYDFIITIPEEGKLEFRATAQDGSGSASAFLGEGNILAAPDVARPDKIGMMMEMAKMDMKMGAHALKFQPGKDERFEMKEEYGMNMGEMSAGNMQAGKKSMEVNSMEEMDMHGEEHSNEGMKPTPQIHEGRHMGHQADSLKGDTMPVEQKKGSREMYKGHHENSKESDHSSHQQMGMANDFDYSHLRSPGKTTYDKNVTVTEILLNLTGNMNRYIWSMNGVPLSETDRIKIKGDEVTRITLNNLTMMHHPMHLHGHFFRVINKNGEYSPLKHTVNVPPMQEITIEFLGNEYGDWFFHCHILYHMMAGMNRVFSYDTKRDDRLEEFPVSKLIRETNLFYTWGILDAASHLTEINLTSSNIRNQFNASFEYGWNRNLEAEFTYERYLHDYLRVFAGINTENVTEDSLESFSTTFVAGVRYFTPYMFDLDVRIDDKLRPRISLGREIMLFPRLSAFGYYEYQFDLGWVDSLPEGVSYQWETVWRAGAEYFLSKNFSLMGSYDNRFGAGGGLSLRF